MKSLFPSVLPSLPVDVLAVDESVCLDRELQRKAQELADAAVAHGLQGALQFCAYRDGVCIVDVCAGQLSTNSGAPTIDDQTLFPIFSTEKPLLATAVHRTVEQGKMSYDEPLKTWWPEFTGDGKENLTLRETLGYRSGMPGSGAQGLGHNAAELRMLGDWDRMTAWFAATRPDIQPGTQQRYMPISYAWALGKPLENVWQKPLNEILREQVLVPSGIAHDFYFAADDEAIARIATVYRSETFETMNDEFCRRTCLPSAWAVSSAHGIARFYNRLCGFDGLPPLIRKETLDAALEPCRWEGDPLPDATTLARDWFMIFGMGYGLWGEADCISRVFGHGGVGGSEGLADRSQRLTIGYTCNFDNAPPNLRESFYSLVGMRWRYRKADVNIQDLQMHLQ